MNTRYFCSVKQEQEMTIKKIILLAGILTCIDILAWAQGARSGAPKGKAIVQVFGNFHSGFGGGKDDRGFELDRTYLGYEYNLGKGLSVKAIMDMGAKTDEYDRVAFIKNTQVTWKKRGWTLSGGLISTTQFNMVEKFWGYRYLYKSFQDQYKFGSSADLGISVAYEPARWVSLDAMIVNGEGYKKIQYKDGLLYGLGATFTPVTGLTLRAYAGINEQPDVKSVINYATFIGYKHKWFSLGAEHSYMQNYKGISNQDKNGFSIYGTGIINKWVEVLVRYDDLSSKDDWSLDEDERILLAGVQFKLGQYVKFAPNFRMTVPKTNNSPNRYSAYMSCYFGL